MQMNNNNNNNHNKSIDSHLQAGEGRQCTLVAICFAIRATYGVIVHGAGSLATLALVSNGDGSILHAAG